MAEPLQEKPIVFETDAVVIGGGLAGTAASIHLARNGFRVICIEQRREIRNIVGESLDWSAPDLFADLGLPMEELVSKEVATWKRHITVASIDGGRKEFLPGEWLAERPWNVELRTLHLDRDRTDACLRETAQRLGVKTLHERVADFAVMDEHNPKTRRILGLRTQQGTFVRASWFIDASGSDASLLGKRFELKSVAYGPRKAAIWSHVTTEEWVEGTTLYMVPSPGEYMEWIWEIPIRPGVSSIGYIAPGSSVKRQRAAGHSTHEILVRQCDRFDRLQEIVEQGHVSQAATTSFLCRTYEGVCGTNWVVVGEAASQSDPITGNGVTAALRHAQEASRLICRYRQRGTISIWARSLYNLRVATVGFYFNSLIEKLFYQPMLRDRIGFFSTARIYTVPAWLMNVVYTRMRPAGSWVRSVAITSILNTIRMCAWLAFQVASLMPSGTANRSQCQPFSTREQIYAL
ncbi:NAD(P)/FAD-dependent oxidoreductase [Occallatibacter savannae]|uniref:NAD(P)/FAD-dependent oxidoreductase n=1 Tax=Occallatibacter savannae TaxID=1002691 RepID=UPI000D69E700|nr:tryptophan 7-halogenase [Occallatibacter savannae]